MEAPRTAPPTHTISSTQGSTARKSTRFAMSAVTALFFMWGFATVLNDILVPHLKSIFDLNYTEVMLVQFAFFSAYFIFSIPSAKLIDSIGYKRTMVVGLLTMGVGALLFIPAAQRSILSAVSHRADGSRRRNHGLAGSSQSLRRGARSAGDGFQPPESHASLQFARNDHRSLPRRPVYSKHSAAKYGRRAADGRSGIAVLSSARGLLGKTPLLVHRPAAHRASRRNRNGQSPSDSRS